MPDRIIRDELLRSPRYRRLTTDTARLLFVHILLSVDSFGNMEAHASAVEDCLRRPTDAETAARLLDELSDAELIRMYSVEGKKYLHVPRFRQRLRYLKGKHPRPPAEIECNEIKALADKVGLRTGSVQVATARSEVKRSEDKQARGRASPPRPDRPPDQNIRGQKSPISKPDPAPKWWKSEAGIDAKARELGIAASGYDSYETLKAKCFAKLNATSP
jgi:hypothetical protein